MDIKSTIRKSLRKLGYDVISYPVQYSPYALARRRKILESNRIDIVLDVGANTGQFGRQLRSLGYTGQIISFEPLSTAYATLHELSQNDSSWRTHNFALGDSNGSAMINIAGNSQSSSLLDMLPTHVAHAPESAYTGQEKIEIKTLDSIFSGLCPEDKNIYLKIDTQGYEQNVIKGAQESMRFIDTVQLEMSLAPLYQGELLLAGHTQLFSQLGYSMVAIEPGFEDVNSGRMLQVDGTFHRFRD